MTQTSEPRFPLIGNALWLDLVNTEPMQRGQRVDLLGNFEDLVDWLEASGAVTAEAGRRAKQRWDGTGQGNLAFREAIRLREVLRRTAERLAGGKSADEVTVTAINKVLASRPVFPQLAREGKHYVTRLEPLSDAAPHLLVPVAESAAWLLEHGDRSLLRRCENPDCVLFFYDTTKNKRRRWCSMDTCGSRAKAAAYYRRHRG
jgi:predicted RNA-binding Zn ribbon-like protein